MFVYQKLKEFPAGRFDFDALTTQDLFGSIHWVVKVKLNLHHSQVTGKILGYAHNFHNMKVRENQNQFFCIAHNFSGFDMFFLLKGIRLSVWGTKNLNICKSELTNINFASLGSQVKFIDAMKYYLSTLGILASTLDDIEKMRIEKLTLQFLNQDHHFLHIRPLLDFD